MVSKKIKGIVSGLAMIGGLSFGTHIMEGLHKGQIQEDLHIEDTPLVTETILHKAACTQYGFPSSLRACYFRGYNKEGHGDETSYVDSLGFHHYRKRNTNIEKAPNTLRIVTLGGSTMANFTGEYLEMILNGELDKHKHELNSDLLKSSLLHELGLESLALKKERAEVINAAVTGLNTNDIRIIYEYSVKPLRPDIIYVNTGGIDTGLGMVFNDDTRRALETAVEQNDESVLTTSSDSWIRKNGVRLIKRENYDPHNPIFDETFSPEPYTSNLVAIVNDALSRGINVGLIKPPFNFSCPQTKRDSLSKFQGFTLYFDDKADIFSRSMPSVLDRIQESHSNDGSSGAKMFVVDVERASNQLPNECDQIGSFDGIHPSDTGMLLQAAVLARDVKGRFYEQKTN